MVLGLLYRAGTRLGSDGIITSTDNVDDGENYEDDVGTLAHWHSGTPAHWHIGTLAHRHTGTLAHWHTGTLAHWHTGTLERAHSWLSLVMVSLLTRSLSNHSLLPTRHLRRSPEIKLHLI